MNETILTLDELKQYLDIVDETHDTELGNLLNVLPEYIHQQTGVWFGEAKEITETLDYERVVFLSHVPVIDVTEIKRGYGDDATALDLANVRISKDTGRITLGYNYGYETTRRDYDEIEVKYTTGIVAVPETIKEAAKLFAAALFNDRANDGMEITSEKVGTLSRTYKTSSREQDLLSAYRMFNA